MVAINENRPVIPRKRVQASWRKSSSFSVARMGTNTCVKDELATRKISCGNAPEAKNASVSIPTPSRVTRYHGIRTASAALQRANAASIRLSLIKLNFFSASLPVKLVWNQAESSHPKSVKLRTM